MLNPFPTLLIYGFIAPTIIRIAIGAAMFYLAAVHFRSQKEVAHLVSPLIGNLSKTTGLMLAVVEGLSGVLLVVGIYTQIGAFIAICMCVKALLVKQKLTALAPLARSTYILLALMGFSLLLSGGGAFAFDLPL